MNKFVKFLKNVHLNQTVTVSKGKVITVTGKSGEVFKYKCSVMKSDGGVDTKYLTWAVTHAALLVSGSGAKVVANRLIKQYPYLSNRILFVD